jgi:hypothetical protein
MVGSMPSHPHLTGPVHCEVIDHTQAKGRESLLKFCCGHCALEASAREVNEMAARLYAGGKIEHGGMGPQTVILLLDQTDTLLGITSIIVADPDMGGGTYIQGYGREKRLRGQLLADEETSLGQALIRAALDYAAAATPGPDTPNAYAAILRFNSGSERVLKDFGFVPMPFEYTAAGLRYTLPGGKQWMNMQQLYQRTAGPPPGALSPDVYTPPPAPPKAPPRPPKRQNRGR